MVDSARYRGTLLGVLVGDALGAPFEGHVGLVAESDIVGVERASSMLCYTDDTAMTLALAESLIRMGGVDEDDLTQAFAHHWALAPERGYSSRTARLLAALHSGTAWREAQARWVGEPGRASNGAAMRVAPAALHAAGRIEDTIEVAHRSARTTHTHPGALAGACVQATAVAVALSHPAGTPIERAGFAAAVRAVSDDPVLATRLDLAEELSSRGDAVEIATRIGTGVLASEAVPAAICAFLSHPDSFREAIVLAVRLGGDTDTIAAMTGAISGALLGESAIPERWLERVESVARVRRLADELFTQAQHTGTP